MMIVAEGERCFGNTNRVAAIVPRRVRLHHVPRAMGRVGAELTVTGRLLFSSGGRQGPVGGQQFTSVKPNRACLF